MMQHFFLVKLQKRIQPCDPIPHIHDVSTARLSLGIIQIHRDDFVQASHLSFIQIVFRYHNIGFSDSAARCIFPCCKPHIRFRAVCPVIDDLRCGVLCNGVMQFVLYGGEKLFCNRTVHIIVCAALGVYVRDFLIKAPFTGANVADAFQLFFKIILPEEVLRLFQALIVHDIALDNVLLQDSVCPDAEHGGFFGVHPIADCNDRVQIIVPRGIVFSVSRSCFQNGNN